MDLARAPRRAPLTARKKGSGYENGHEGTAFSYPEPFLRAFDRARRGALAKSITGYHKNMVREQYPVLELRVR